MTSTVLPNAARVSSPAPPFAAPEPVRARTVVLGLGNDILSDDGVGLAVARQLREQLPPDGDVVVLEVCEMGLALLDLIVDHETLFLVDSIQTGQAPPGTLHEFSSEQIQTRRAGSPHFLGVGETLALGRFLELPMPDKVRILAIEVQDPFTLGTDLTPKVAAAVAPAVTRLRHWLRGQSSLLTLDRPE